MPLSDLAIERKLKKDGLMITPTSYKGPGVYKIDNWRISELQQFLFLVIHSEQDTIDIMLLAGTEASKRSITSPTVFQTYRKTISIMGEASATFFSCCAEAFASSTNVTEAIRSCYPFRDKWLESINEGKKWFQKEYQLV